MSKKSNKYTVQSPMSYIGSTRRLWMISNNTIYRIFAATILIPTAWCFITAWYMLFGILLIPYRIIRRSNRKNKLARIQHDELMEMLRNKKK